MFSYAKIGSMRSRMIIAGLALASVFGYWFWQSSSPSSMPVAAPLAEVAPGAVISDVLVFVSGAVAHPGMYRLSPDARGTDAVAAAGGLLPTANLAKLPNLAAKVHDGRQINIPVGTTSSAAKLDINEAGLDELDSIPGMPAGLPQAILDYRAQWGPFLTMSQLHSDLEVDSATVSALSHYLRVVPQQ